MKQNRKKGLMWITFSTIIFYTILIISILWALQVFFIKDFYIAGKNLKIENKTQVIQNILYEDDYQEQINQIIKNDDYCVMVFEADKMIFATSGFDGAECPVLENEEELQKQYDELLQKSMQSSDIVKTRIHSTDFGDRPPVKPGETLPPLSKKESKNKEIVKIKYYSMKYHASQTPRMLLVDARLTPLDATLHTLKVQLAMISIVMMIVAIITAYYIAKRLSRPIVEISKEAKSLANGNYDFHFDGKTYREVEELSETLKYAAKELNKVDTLRNEFIANMSHDLRTPLTMIIGYGEIMRDIPGENTAENVQVIIDESVRLNKLVNDILDISKLNAGVDVCNLTRFNITTLIQSIINRHEKFLNLPSNLIRFDYTQEIEVFADQIKIEQVIYNLLTNAIHHTNNVQEIKVTQKVEGNRVRIDIKDNGKGIEEDQLPYIWNRYYKINKQYVRSKVGSGMGLSIVKAIFDVHQIEYGVTSKINEGTCFYFYLNIA